MKFSMSYGVENHLISYSDNNKISFLTRNLSSNDIYTKERTAYIESIFENVSHRNFFDEETYSVSRAWGDYEVLLLSGNDPLRMGRYLRANRFLINSIAKIAVLHGSTPPRRARLFNAGFDEVLDSAKMPAEEAIARIKAVVLRYEVQRQTRQTKIARDASIATFCNPFDLTPREQALLWALAHNAGQAISVSQIAKLIDAEDPLKLKRSIKVSISNLRRKLFDGYVIESDYQGGYGLYASTDLAIPG